MCDTRVRAASRADNPRLLELFERTPMIGSVSLWPDRSPDFYALNGLQGERFYSVVQEDEGTDKIVALGTSCIGQRYVAGAPQRVAYICDLRVDPAHRGTRALANIYRAQTGLLWREESCALAFTYVLSDNGAMNRSIKRQHRPRRRGVFPEYHSLGRFKEYALFLLAKASRPIGAARIRRARAEDLPEIARLIDAHHRRLNFAPAFSVDEFSSLLNRLPGFSIENFYLAIQGRRLLGVLAHWDASCVKRLRVLGYSARLHLLRILLEPLKHVRGVALLPKPGNALRFAYATMLGLADAGDMTTQAALVRAIYNDLRGSDLAFLSLALHERDPAVGIVKGFIRDSVSSTAYAVSTPKFASLPSQLGRRLPYGDYFLF